MEIINLLMIRPMSVTEICKKTKEEQSKVSHNLKKLASCNVLEIRKEGKKQDLFFKQGNYSSFNEASRETRSKILQ